MGYNAQTVQDVWTACGVLEQVNHLTVSPASLAFGPSGVGAPADLNLILSNHGAVSTTVTGLVFDNPAFTSSASLPLTVPVGVNVTVSLRFQPTALGPVSGNLTLASNADESPILVVPLSGTGVTPASATLAPNGFTLSLAMGQAPADRTSTLSNVVNAGGDNLDWRIASIQQTGSPVPPVTAAPASVLPLVRTDLIYAKDNYSRPYVPGRVIVGYMPGKNGFASSLAAAASGIKQMQELARAIVPKTGRKANAGRKVVLLTLQDANGVRQAIDLLRKDANVAYAEPDYIQETVALPNDPSFGLLDGMRNTGQNDGTVDADIDAPEAWDRHTGNRSILIGVLDTGIDYLHPDLAANIWTNPGEIAANGIDDDGNGFIDDMHGWDFGDDDNDPTDRQYHGTHVSGTLAAVGNNGVGVAGVMWTASLVALKSFPNSGVASTSDAVDALNYANAMGVRITNNSWGGGGFSQALMDAIAAGGLFVAGAGNNSVNNDFFPFYPSSYPLDNVIAVAATDNLDNLADISNFGHTTVHLGAPGVNIYSTVPGNGYRTLTGTSMATPHVSGAAGLVWSLHPTMTAAQVKATLLASTDPIPALDGRSVTGGRLNARRALDAAKLNWLTASPMTPGILAPGESTPITVTVDPAGLVAGRWTGLVNVSTDDPAHPVLPISVTADIAGCRSLTVDSLSHDFGDQYVGFAARTLLTLRNACNDTVKVLAVSSSNPAFSLAGSLPIKVPPFQILSVPAEFLPSAVGPASGTLSLTSDADTNPMKTVSLLGQGVLPPHATVTPASVSRTLARGATTVVDLDIGNSGGSDLLWSLTPVSRGSVSPAAPDIRVGPPVTEAVGGPDEFGYQWTDSDQPGGPVYQWQDISATGALVLSGCDDCNDIKPLSFAFPIYGNRFSQVNITSNGWVNFGLTDNKRDNFAIPDTRMPGNMVAGFFDDLSTYIGGVYFQDFGDRAVIQYQNVGYFQGAGTVTFQIVLHSDGEIDFYYENMTGLLHSSTTGIQNGSGSVGLQVSYYTPYYIKNHLAVRIRNLPDWLRASEISGTVPAGGSRRLALTLDAGWLTAGNYTHTMTLASNHPLQAPISIPVDLSVTGDTGVSRVFRVGPSALELAAGSRYSLWNASVGGETRGLLQGSLYTLYLK